MPTILFTDLAVQRLKTEKQTRFMDQSLPGFGLICGKRTKTWIVIRGEDRRLTTIGRYPETSLKDARTRAKLEMTKPSYSDAIEAPDAVLHYLSDCKGRVEKQTLDQYTYYLGFFALKGKLPEVTRTYIRRKLVELGEKPTAQNMAFSTLRRFFNWCLHQDYLDKHPLLGLDNPNKLKSRKRVLTDAELVAIWKATDPEDGSPGNRKFNRMVRILMLTGQRRSEINGLKPENVDVNMTFPKTKNGFSHSIPITPLVREHLQVPFTFNDWNRCKERLDKLSGVTDWTIHDLRRTFATNCAKLGLPIHIVEKILNHIRSAVLTNVARVYNQYSYLPEMQEALLTHEAFIIKLVAAQGHNPEPRVALHQGDHREVPQQARTASQDEPLDSAHHP